MHFSESGQTYPQKIMPMEGKSFYGLFLCVCAKLQRLTISFGMSAHLSAWNNSIPSGHKSMRFDI